CRTTASQCAMTACAARAHGICSPRPARGSAVAPSQPSAAVQVALSQNQRRLPVARGAAAPGASCTPARPRGDGPPDPAGAGCRYPSMVWRLRATRMLNTLGAGLSPTHGSGCSFVQLLLSLTRSAHLVWLESHVADANHRSRYPVLCALVHNHADEVFEL